MIMMWEDLLSTKRKNDSDITRIKKIESNVFINPFDFDYRRIVQSASFRRLQDKTQVFPLEKIDFVITRLTHSIEVSAIAEGIGQMVVKNLKEHLLKKNEVDIDDIPNILKCAGLIHDLGNPPFGHFGEHIIQTWFKKNLSELNIHKIPLYTEKENCILEDYLATDFCNFDGNAHTFRIVNRLHIDRGQSGLNLTNAVLSSIGKYTVPSKEIKKDDRITSKKMGYLYSEQEDILDIARDVGTLAEDNQTIHRHPLSFIVEAADDIAYRLADLEDTFKKGLVSLTDLINYMNKQLNHYASSREEGALSKTTELIEELTRLHLEDDLNTDYNILNKWLFDVQIHLMNVAKFSFTRNYSKIMAGTYNDDLFKNTYHEYTMEILKDVSVKFAFSNRDVNVLELSSEVIIVYFLDKLVPAVIHYGTDAMSKVDKKFIELISDNYLENYKLIAKDLETKHAGRELEMHKLYHRILVAIDFIAGMTDTYARDLYNKLQGID
ncbi:dNTP triphosphohydrolase [Paenibacillus polysaccharolyticus]|uniref:dGTP triphosphohydrolase n=1 Tax=Paenibacillus polysaccharolyticus TaxID=582692 RepID=UPI00203E5ECB|nr:dNTP triphosphohydrolase [Paenibacillus polysaccharolyticus]MCM3136241.1 dNTP triphosphohydrolase [Paenibacillus polysaccharolyticus]